MVLGRESELCVSWVTCVGRIWSAKGEYEWIPREREHALLTSCLLHVSIESDYARSWNNYENLYSLLACRLLLKPNLAYDILGYSVCEGQEIREFA